MKKLLFFVFGWMGMLAASGQVMTAEPLPELNGIGWAAGLHTDGLVLQTERRSTLRISDEGLQPERREQTQLHKHGETWSSYPPDSAQRIGMPENSIECVGTWSQRGDAVFFSLADGAYGYPAGSLVQGRIAGAGIDSVKLVLAAANGERNIHPSVSADGEQIVFSSNRTGGAGKFDLYYLNRLANGWSDPVSLGNAVNSPANEVFPVWNDDQVYFSSDRTGGAGKLDVYATPRSLQYATIERLPSPINSAGDDFQLLWLDDNNAFISTDRGGADAVLRLRRDRPRVFADGLRAELVCAGTPVQNAQVTLRNTLGELVVSDRTASNGSFDIGTLELQRSYRATFEGAPQAVLERSLLYIVNAEGKRIMVFAPDRDGRFLFELMPPNDGDRFELVENTDDSRLLNIGIEGQLVGNEGVNAGEVIYVEDGEGRVTALTYTTEGGRFKFDELSPELQYTFRFDENSKVMKMVIFDRGEEIELAVNNGKVVYTRVAPEEAIRLNDERNNPIAIRSDDLFVIRNVYYAFNSAELNADARAELDRLAALLKNNPNFRASLSSHTDSRGTDAFNLELSNRRAAACLAYLTSKGVAAIRLEAKGMGESVLRNGCADGVECDEELHAENRRTELVLLAPKR